MRNLKRGRISDYSLGGCCRQWSCNRETHMPHMPRASVHKEAEYVSVGRNQVSVIETSYKLTKERSVRDGSHGREKDAIVSTDSL